MRFETHPPPAEVSVAVREMWLLTDDGRPCVGLPKPHVELVISLSGVHWWRPARAAAEQRYVVGWLTPLQSAPRYARAAGRRHLIGARLEPWAATALFGPYRVDTPPVPLTGLVGAEAGRLRAELRRQPSDDERFAALGAWLAAQPALRETPPPPSADVAEPRVGRLAATMRLSPRTLRRRFAQQVVVGPKRWLQLRRLDAVLRDDALFDPAETFAAVAAAHGFADQAHLAREIARFTGATPTELRSRARDAPPHFLPQS
jgi:AraC-like DNA-binding protein